MNCDYEIYALANERSAAFARAFLDRFLPRRRSVHADFPVPELVDSPRFVFSSETEILNHLEQNVQEPYGLYWDDLDPDSSRQAMLFFTRDEKVIVGLAEFTDVPEERLREVARFVGATHSIVCSEQRPPETAAEFMALCERSSGQLSDRD